MSTSAPRRRRPRPSAVCAAIAGIAVVALAAVATFGVTVGEAAVTTTTVRPTTVAPTSVSPTTTGAAAVPTLPEPADAESDPARTLVPTIVAFDDVLEGAERQEAVTSVLTEGGNTVARESAPRTVCAVVRVAAPVMAGGRWEHDGEPLGDAATDVVRRDPPGYGDCITTEDVADFDDGVYQYVATGTTGARSAAATLVVGAPSVVVWLLNDGQQSVCLVQLSPASADFYESFESDSELLPGEALAVSVAAVDQDVRVYGCPPDDVVRSFELAPRFGVYVDLFDGDEPGESPPPPSTTSRPTTTV